MKMSRSEGGKVKRAEDSPVRVGVTREEIHRTLVETVHDILAGRITSKEAWRIGHAAAAQLKLLRVMERLEEKIEKERERRKVQGSKGQGSKDVRKAGGQAGRNGEVRWVN